MCAIAQAHLGFPNKRARPRFSSVQVLIAMTIHSTPQQRNRQVESGEWRQRLHGWASVTEVASGLNCFDLGQDVKAIWHLCDCNSRKLLGVTVEEEMKWRMEMRIVVAADTEHHGLVGFGVCCANCNPVRNWLRQSS
jgi:hypothetical protein